MDDFLPLPPPLPNQPMVGRFRSDDRCFWNSQSSQSKWVPFYTTTQYDWPLLSAEKISSFLSHLVAEIIIGPKLVYFLTKMYYLTYFKHFVSFFSLIFDPIDPLLH